MGKSRSKSESDCSRHPSNKIDSNTEESIKRVQSISFNYHTVNISSTSESSIKPNCNESIEIIISDSDNDKQTDKSVAKPPTTNNSEDTIVKIIISDTTDSSSDSSDSSSSESSNSFTEKSVKNHNEGVKTNFNYYSRYPKSLIENSLGTNGSRSSIKSKNQNDKRNITSFNTVTHHNSPANSNVDIIISDTSDINSITSPSQIRSLSPGIPNIDSVINNTTIEKYESISYDSPIVKKKMNSDVLINPEDMDLSLITSNANENIQNISKEKFCLTVTVSSEVASLKRKVTNMSEDDKADTRSVRQATGHSNNLTDTQRDNNKSSSALVTISPLTNVTEKIKNNVENDIATSKYKVKDILRTESHEKPRDVIKSNIEVLDNIRSFPKPISGKRRYDDYSSTSVDSDEDYDSDDYMGETDDSDYDSRKKMKKALKVMCNRRSKWRKFDTATGVQVSTNPSQLHQLLDKKKRKHCDCKFPCICETISYSNGRYDPSTDVNNFDVRDNIVPNAPKVPKTSANLNNEVNTNSDLAILGPHIDSTKPKTSNGSSFLTMTSNNVCTYTDNHQHLDALLAISNVKTSEFAMPSITYAKTETSKISEDFVHSLSTIPKISVDSDSCITTNITTSSNTHFQKGICELERSSAMPTTPSDGSEYSNSKVATANNEVTSCISSHRMLHSLMDFIEKPIAESAYDVTTSGLLKLSSVPADGEQSIPTIATSNNHGSSKELVTSKGLSCVSNEIAISEWTDPSSIVLSGNENPWNYIGSEQVSSVILSTPITTNNEIVKDVSNRPIIMDVKNNNLNINSQHKDSEILDVKNIDGVKKFLEEFHYLYCTETNHNHCYPQNKHTNTDPLKTVYPNNCRKDPNIPSSNQDIETIEIDDDSTNSSIIDLSDKLISQNYQSLNNQSKGNYDFDIKLDIEKHVTPNIINTPTCNSDIQTIKIDNDTDSESEPRKENIDGRISVPKPKILKQCTAVRRKIRIVTLKRKVIDRRDCNLNIDVIEIDDDDEETTNNDIIKKDPEDNESGSNNTIKYEKCNVEPFYELVKKDLNVILDKTCEKNGKPLERNNLPKAISDMNIYEKDNQESLPQVNIITETSKLVQVRNKNVHPIKQNNLRDYTSDVVNYETDIQVNITQDHCTPEAKILLRTDKVISEECEHLTHENSILQTSNSDQLCKDIVHPIEQKDLLDVNTGIGFSELHVSTTQDNTIPEISTLDQPSNEINSSNKCNGLQDSISEIYMQVSISRENHIPKTSKLDQACKDTIKPNGNNNVSVDLSGIGMPQKNTDPRNKLSESLPDLDITVRDRKMNLSQESIITERSKLNHAYQKRNDVRDPTSDIVVSETNMQANITQENYIDKKNNFDQACDDTIRMIDGTHLQVDMSDTIVSEPETHNIMQVNMSEAITNYNKNIDINNFKQVASNSFTIDKVCSVALSNHFKERLPHKIVHKNLHQNLGSNDNKCNNKNGTSDNTEPDLDALVKNLMVLSANNQTTKLPVLDEQIVDFLLHSGVGNPTERSEDIQLDDIILTTDSNKIKQCNNEENIDRLLVDYILDTDKNDKDSESNIVKVFDDISISDESTTAELLNTKPAEEIISDLNESIKLYVEENNNYASTEKKGNCMEVSESSLGEYNTKNTEEPIGYEFNEESVKIMIEEYASEFDFGNEINVYHHDNIIFTEGFLLESYIENKSNVHCATNKSSNGEDNDSENNFEEKFVDFILNDDLPDKERFYDINLDVENSNASVAELSSNDAHDNSSKVQTEIDLLNDSDIEIDVRNKIDNADPQCNNYNERNHNSDAEDYTICRYIAEEYAEYVLKNKSSPISSVNVNDDLPNNLAINNGRIYVQLGLKDHKYLLKDNVNMIKNDASTVESKSDEFSDIEINNVVIRDNDDTGTNVIVRALKIINGDDESMEVIENDFDDNSGEFVNYANIPSNTHQLSWTDGVSEENSLFFIGTCCNNAVRVETYSEDDLIDGDKTYIEIGNSEITTYDKTLTEYEKYLKGISEIKMNVITDYNSDNSPRVNETSGNLVNIDYIPEYNSDSNNNPIVKALRVMNNDPEMDLVDNNLEHEDLNSETLGNDRRVCDDINKSNKQNSLISERTIEGILENSEEECVVNNGNSAYQMLILDGNTDVGIPFLHDLRVNNNVDKGIENEYPINYNKTYYEQDGSMDLSVKRVEKDDRHTSMVLSSSNKRNGNMEVAQPCNGYSLNRENIFKFSPAHPKCKEVSAGSYGGSVLPEKGKCNNTNYIRMVGSQSNQRKIVSSNALKQSNMDVSRLCFTPERNILNSVPPPVMVF